MDDRPVGQRKLGELVIGAAMIIGREEMHGLVDGRNLAGIVGAAADKIIVGNKHELIADQEHIGIGRIAAADGHVPIGRQAKRNGVAAVPVRDETVPLGK